MKIRMATDEDKPRLAEMIAKDPYHAGKFTPEFFLGLMYNPETKEWIKDPAIECAAVEDDEGAVFFVRYNRSLRLFVQFDKDQKQRNRQSLVEALPFFTAMSKNAGFKEMVFDSSSPPLIAFAKKRLGFVACPDFVLPV